ncbi:MAG: isoprenylcysteine carboxylmethyltransferase family protein [Rikenellaceae bacterium]|jgi:protein-S-isoprenylcysteine O-methyltransferase Ste14|nr:isoprenylcysteine carboxylmethyltransferase family protein [Rikenellaceae bacterium]
MNSDNFFRIVAGAIIVAFYAIYFGKMLSQRWRGIRTDQIARGTKSPKLFATELTMKIATYSTVCVQIASIWLGTTLPYPALRVIGVVLGVAGVVVFGVAVVTMRDSWRAGIPSEDRTGLVTGGIFNVSRNPAFVGFDLVYAGIVAICFNPLLVGISVVSAVMLHLQILREEEYLTATFGKPYTDYITKTRRYFGRR